MQVSGVGQIFQWAPPASATAISDPMMAATRVISFMVSSPEPFCGCALRLLLEPVVSAACHDRGGERAEREGEALECPHDFLPSVHAARMEGGAKTGLRSL